jgi:hypothetical protein
MEARPPRSPRRHRRIFIPTILFGPQGEQEIMSTHVSLQNAIPNPQDPTITIRVAGKLFQGHLSYLDQLIQSAVDCQLWPLLNLTALEELDKAALLYLVDREDLAFRIVGCPRFIREWMEHEKERAA